MGRKAAAGKNPFADLSKEFREKAEGTMDEQTLRSMISETAISQAQLMDAKDEDLDLAEKQEQVKFASEVYTDGTKQNKLKIKFAKQRLEELGKL